MDVTKRKILMLMAAIKRRLSLSKCLYAKARLRYRCVLLALLKLASDLPAGFLKYSLPKRSPVIWAFPRHQYAFEAYFNNEELECPAYWKSNFRMSKETFLKIVDIARPFMAPNPNYVRQPVLTEKRVAIVLNWFSSGSSYHQVGEIFGVHKATVIKFVKIFLIGMMALRDQFIRFPHTHAEIEKCIGTFSHKTNLPHVLGAIDGTHVPITKPQGDSAVDYYSRKQVHTITCQAVCDGDLTFLCIDAGFPGSIHDCRMLEHSWLFSHVEDEGMLNTPTTKIGDTEISPYLLGDPAYPLVKWIMKPYEYGTRDQNKKKFNYELSRARSVIERAFGLLKGRFRILMKKMEHSPKTAAEIFLVCCILHNILQQNGEIESEEYADNMLVSNERETMAEKDGEKKRKLLTQYLDNQ